MTTLASDGPRGYAGAMVRIGKAQLKAGLDAHLESVRLGETAVVTDGGRAIAQIIPLDPLAMDLVVHPAKGSIHDIALPGPCGDPSDVMEQLLEDRRDRL